ncbi:MAG: tetratricopeptide repeat protein [Candidatus Kapaibacterium sp.]
MVNQDEGLNSGDEIVGTFQEIQVGAAGESASNLKNKIRMAVGILGVLIIGVLAVVFYNKSKAEKEQEASAALARVRTLYEGGDYKQALSGDPAKLIRETPLMGLQEIVEQFGSTENGKVAALYAGNSLISLKKHAEALGYYEKALGSSSMEVSVGATIGIAVCKEEQKEYDNAGEYYGKAAQLTLQPTLKDKYKLYAALSFEKAGNKEKAEKLYREILHGESMEYIGESKSGLTRLGMIVE